MKKNSLIIVSCGIILSNFCGSNIAFSSASEVGVGAIKPEKALQQLIDGNERFAAGKNSYPRNNEARREETTKNGQHPIAAIVSCSDSRVPLEFIFDQGIGDIFAVRIAGNIIGVNETGSIEYGVEHLGIPLIVVLGHTKCGAVTATVENAKVEGNVLNLVKSISPAVERARKKSPEIKGVDLVPSAIEENVLQSINSLEKNAKIKNLEKEGKLMIVGGVYGIETGRIKWLENEFILNNPVSVKTEKAVAPRQLQ